MSDSLPSKQKRRGLGRGLSALFDDEEDDAAAPSQEKEEDGALPGRRMLGIDQLEPGTFQPRRMMDPDSLAELASSIALHGVLQPILVREFATRPGRYEIIAGERRWRASQKAQLHEVPVIVKDFDDATALQVALIENLQREDLNAVEEALGYRRLMDEFGHTQERLATMLGKSRSHVANMVRLLSLPDSVLDEIRQGKISAGHARALITSSDPELLLQQILSQGLSVRETERLANDAAGKPKRPQATTEKIPKDVDTLALEAEMSAALGMRVAIDLKGAGIGGVRIDFQSLDQLDDILRRLSASKTGRLTSF
jgi:ParB family chromosome partitioning protein